MNSEYKKYDLNSAEDMISLAMEVQIAVYWGCHFHINDNYNELHNFKRDFWSILEEEKSKGMTHVKVSEGYNYVQFTKEDKDNG